MPPCKQVVPATDRDFTQLAFGAGTALPCWWALPESKPAGVVAEGAWDGKAPAHDRDAGMASENGSIARGHGRIGVCLQYWARAGVGSALHTCQGTPASVLNQSAHHGPGLGDVR